MSKNRKYTKEFKLEVLEMAASGEKSIPELAEDLGINANLIYRWRQRYQVDKETEQLLPSNEQQLLIENRRLQRALKVAEQESGID